MASSKNPRSVATGTRTTQTSHKVAITPKQAGGAKPATYDAPKKLIKGTPPEFKGVNTPKLKVESNGMVKKWENSNTTGKVSARGGTPKTTVSTPIAKAPQKSDSRKMPPNESKTSHKIAIKPPEPNYAVPNRKGAVTYNELGYNITKKYTAPKKTRPSQ